MSDVPPSTRILEEAAATLRTLRGSIDEVDDALIDLLNRRAHLACDVAKAKAQASLRAYVPERERQLLDRLCARSRGPLPEHSLRLIYKEIISACLALESPLEVAFLGPEATFTHEATKRYFGLSARLKACRSIPDVFDDVERSRCAFGVVPIENSSEGMVDHTLDAFTRSRLQICAEVLLEVSHHLLTHSGDVIGVTKVYSPLQALEQCRSWLHANLPGVPHVDVPNTARAAQLAAEDPTAAAVATDLAASMYGLRIAASNLDDLGGNLTRFLVIGHDEPSPTGQDRTSIMFALKDTAGVLYEALGSFARAGINMSRIESRPSRRQPWEYLFFIDLDGHRTAPDVSEAIASLQTTCSFMRVLGSYPQGRLTSRLAGRKPPQESLPPLPQAEK